MESQDYVLIDAFRDKYIYHLKNYYYVGGMPEAVDNDWRLVVEGVYWTTAPWYTFTGTAYTWGKIIERSFGSDTYGTNIFKRYTNGIYNGCAKLEMPDCSLEVCSNSGLLYTNGQMATRTNGLGIMILRLTDDSIHTYHEPNGSLGNPEPAGPDKTGKFNLLYPAHHTLVLTVLSYKHLRCRKRYSPHTVVLTPFTFTFSSSSIGITRHFLLSIIWERI